MHLVSSICFRFFSYLLDPLFSKRTALKPPLRTIVWSDFPYAIFLPSTLGYRGCCEAGYLLQEKCCGPGRASNSPLGSEVHKLGGETVCWELRGWFLHHLLQLLERGPPGLVRKP